MTHLLNDSSRLIIEELLKEPADARTVAAAFALQGDDGNEQALTDEIRETLEHFEELGLIERA